MRLFSILLCFLSFSLLNVHCYAQKGNFTGTITSQNEPLEGANILLIPDDTSQLPVFGITDAKGFFSVEVSLSIKYKLTITYIGKQNIDESISFTKSDTEKNYALIDASDELEEVTLNYTPKIQIKKDTITYSVDGFSNGKERKLKEILRKFPGVEVDRAGNVYLNNKKVGKVFVENRLFFNGKTKLAVENIPVDAVEKVEFIDDYNETAFLKNVVDSEQLVMNILLKDDKKGIVFGDIEVGGGIEERYRVHPSIFKFTPTSSFNIIGDFNNTATKSFNLSDYLSFEAESDPSRFGEILNSSVVKFLQNDDFFDNRHQFLGFNGDYNPSKAHTLRLFLIGLNDDSKSQTTNEFIFQATQQDERRTIETNRSNRIFLGKLDYRYTPNDSLDIKWDVSFERSDLEGAGANISEVNDSITSFSNTLFSDNTVVNSSFEWNKFFSERNISSANINYRYKEGDFNQNWIGDNRFFTPLLPVLDDTSFTISGNEREVVSEFAFDARHYYRISRRDLLTFKVSGALRNNNISSDAFQRLTNNEVSSFEDFNILFSSNFQRFDNSITYERHFGKLISSVGLRYFNATWDDENQGISLINRNTNILPSAKLEWRFNTKQKLIFRFNLNRNNPNPFQRLNGQRLDNFNSILRGNQNIDQSENQRYVLSFSSFKPYGLSVYSNIGFRTIQNQIIYSNSFQGINGLRTPIQTDIRSKTYDAFIRLNYNNKKDWRVSLTNTYFNRETPSVLNDMNITSTTQAIENVLSFSTKYEKYPNIFADIKNTFSIRDNDLFRNETNTTQLDISAEYDIGNWKFQMDYNQVFFRNRTQSTRSDFDRISGSIFYHKENSPWEFGMNFYNLGDNASRVSNSFNESLFSETNTLVFPQTILFNVYYKL